MGWGRGWLPFFSVAQRIGRYTQTWHCTVHPFLFRITVIVSIPFFRRGWDPIRADIPLFVDRDICEAGHVKNSCCEALVGCIFRSQNWAAKAVASAVVRMACSLWEHASGCERDVRGFFARLPGSCRVTCTHSAPPERALLRVDGFCGASGEATAHGVNLYEDMATAC